MAMNFSLLHKSILYCDGNIIPGILTEVVILSITCICNSNKVSS